MDALGSKSGNPQAHPDNLYFHTLPQPPHDELQEILDSLSADQPWLSPRFFYDAQGSQLFDRITQTPEYYPTRTEQAIFREHRPAMMDAATGAEILIEPGSGNCEKAAPFIRDHGVQHYVPIEFSGDFLLASCKRLLQRFPQLQVHALCTDFTRCDRLPESIPHQQRLLFFPGSTIGNFEPEQARALLARFARLVGSEGYLLIGVDLKKSPARLNAAYNDQAGITAAFNRNVLDHLNRRLDCDFQVADFTHKAFYNEALGRVEMHLVARRDSQVRVDGHQLHFEQGQSIHTESSWKYTIGEFQALAASAGMQSIAVWTDDEDLFSVHLLQGAQ